MDRKERAALRRAVADAITSAGCGCCRDRDEHDRHLATLGKLLKVRKYDDGSGYDFYRYKTKREGANDDN